MSHINLFRENFKMTTKQIILSSAGLKNVILGTNLEDEFEFIFGNHKIRINNIFADFISPVVSKMHLSDPTINCIDFTEQTNGVTITDDVLLLIKSLSKGSSIEIDENQIVQMQTISILLGNKEILSQINGKIDSKTNEKNIDQYLTYLTFLYQISPSNCITKCTNIIDFIASHFYEIEESKLVLLPIEILHAIILNDNLVVESEDSLFEFIRKVFNDKEDDCEYGITSFYEGLEFTELSEDKFNEFIEIFSGSEMTEMLWKKLRICFYSNMKNHSATVNTSRYSDRKIILYKESHPFEGVIGYLTQKSGGNVADNGTVNVTSSSTNNGYAPKNAVDLLNTQNYFQASGMTFADWLQYDFIKRRVLPTHYSIRTRHEYDYNHPRNWVIEGSNTGGESDSEWTVLDSHQDDEALKGLSFSYAFDIKNSQASKEGYRYLRLRQTGKSSGNNTNLTLSALEFFGTLFG